MDARFGSTVKQEALRLEDSGKDPNQIAGILCKKDPEGANYGIGIVVGGDGKPLASSSVLLEYIAAETQASTSGSYNNSAALMGELKKSVLKWQRIPEEYNDRFILALPSDAGTGAVQTAVHFNLVLDPGLKTLGIEEWGWPAYKAIAKVARLRVKEFPFENNMEEEGALIIHQAGPMNTTGEVKDKSLNQSRAKSVSKNQNPLILDRAYPGFEFARLTGSKPYHDIMKMSAAHQMQPFLDAGIPFALALSPTKAFVTFSLRPCGFLLVFCPDPAYKKVAEGALNTVIRARGSSFEHVVSRAFVQAMTKSLDRLEKEHEASLERLGEAEALWQKLVKGTKMEYLFSEKFAGLFRNPRSEKDSDIRIYNEHIYPVFSGNRCRLNTTGLPSEESKASKHVSVLSSCCY